MPEQTTTVGEVEGAGGAQAAVVRYRLTRPQRVALSMPLVALVLCALNWPVPGTKPDVGEQIVLTVASFLVGWILSGRPGLEIRPGAAFVVRGLRRVDFLPFSEVRAIGTEPATTGPSLVIHTRSGRWEVTAPAGALDGSFAAKVDEVRRAWAESGARPAPPGLVPWGPDPASGAEVVLRPCSLASAFPRQIGLRPYLISLTPLAATIGAASLLHDQPAQALALLAAAAVGAWALWAPRVRVRAEGIDVRVLVRTTFVPWSMVCAMTVASTRPNTWHQNRRDPASVRLLTTIGWVDLPVPALAPGTHDPEAWRKVDYLERCWVANRGPTWVGAPAPPPQPPPPTLPPPPAGAG